MLRTIATLDADKLYEPVAVLQLHQNHLDRMDDRNFALILDKSTMIETKNY